MPAVIGRQLAFLRAKGEAVPSSRTASRLRALGGSVACLPGGFWAGSVRWTDRTGAWSPAAANRNSSR
jgi:hypothetical protein